MKTEELTSIGLNEDQIKEVFKLNGEDVTKAKASAKEEANADLEELKTQLATAKTQLKSFEGIDPTQLTKEIQSLNEQLAQKDRDFAQRIADRDFNDLLKESITMAGARNTKAVTAMLDIETLRQSKNQKEDIAKALEAVKVSDDYLFVSNEPVKNPVGKTGAGVGANTSFTTNATLTEKARRVMGLPPIEKK